MSLPIWQATITNANGDVIPGAEIEVIDEATGLALAGGLFSNRAGTFSLTNPFFADSNGFASFYAEPGEYSISATDVGTSENRTWRYVVLSGTSSIESDTKYSHRQNNLSDMEDLSAARDNIEVYSKVEVNQFVKYKSLSAHINIDATSSFVIGDGDLQITNISNTGPGGTIYAIQFNQNITPANGFSFSVNSIAVGVAAEIRSVTNDIVEISTRKISDNSNTKDPFYLNVNYEI